MPDPIVDTHVNLSITDPCDRCGQPSPDGLRRCGLCKVWLCGPCLADHQMQRFAVVTTHGHGTRTEPLDTPACECEVVQAEARLSAAIAADADLLLRRPAPEDYDLARSRYRKRQQVRRGRP